MISSQRKRINIDIVPDILFIDYSTYLLILTFYNMIVLFLIIIFVLSYLFLSSTIFFNLGKIINAFYNFIFQNKVIFILVAWYGYKVYTLYNKHHLLDYIKTKNNLIHTSINNNNLIDSENNKILKILTPFSILEHSTYNIFINNILLLIVFLYLFIIFKWLSLLAIFTFYIFIFLIGTLFNIALNFHSNIISNYYNSLVFTGILSKQKIINTNPDFIIIIFSNLMHLTTESNRWITNLRNIFMNSNFLTIIFAITVIFIISIRIYSTIIFISILIILILILIIFGIIAEKITISLKRYIEINNAETFINYINTKIINFYLIYKMSYDVRNFLAILPIFIIFVSSYLNLPFIVQFSLDFLSIQIILDIVTLYDKLLIIPFRAYYIRTKDSITYNNVILLLQNRDSVVFLDQSNNLHILSKSDVQEIVY
ncbi:hypothetical protein YN1_7930 [Nanoarchaeota archaeon]